MSDIQFGLVFGLPRPRNKVCPARSDSLTTARQMPAGETGPGTLPGSEMFQTMHSAQLILRGPRRRCLETTLPLRVIMTLTMLRTIAASRCQVPALAQVPLARGGEHVLNLPRHAARPALACARRRAPRRRALRHGLGGGSARFPVLADAATAGGIGGHASAERSESALRSRKKFPRSAKATC